MSTQDGTTTRFRETNTAIEMEDLGASTILEGEELPEVEFPGKLGPAFISVIVFTVLAAIIPPIVYAADPILVGSLGTSRAWAAFIGSWLALAFPPAIMVGALVYYLPTLTCGYADSADPVSGRVPRSCFGKLTWWTANTAPVTYECMGKFWWTGIGFTLATVIVEYILIIIFGVIIGAHLFFQVINPGPVPTNSTGTVPDTPTEVPTGLAIGSIFYMSFFVAALVEETAKFCFAATMSCHRPQIRHPHTVAVLLVIGTLGFATCENYFYVFSATRTGSLAVVAATVFSRFFISVPFHATTALWMSSLLSSSVINRALTFMDYARAIWLPVLCHGLFDFSLLLAEYLSINNPSGPLQGLSVALMFVPLLILILFGVFAYRRMLQAIYDFETRERVSV